MAKSELNSTGKFVRLSIVVVINIVLQFLFQRYILTFFGAGRQSDIFFGAAAFPQFILAVLSGSLTMVLVPILSRYAGDEFLENAWNYFQAVGLLFLFITTALLLTASWWVGLVLPGFKGTNYGLAINLVRIELIGMLFSALLSVVWAIHSSRNNFILIETTGIIANAVAFGVLIIAVKQFGIYAAAWANVLQVVLQVLFLMKIMGAYRRPVFNSPSFKETWKKLKPLMAGSVYYKTDTLIDKYLTSTAVPGELTLLNLAQQLYAVGSGILSKVLVNTMIPGLAKASAEGDEKRYNQLFKKRLLLSFLCTGAVFVGVIFLGKWALGFIFSFNKFDLHDVQKLWWLLLLLVGYWVAALAGGVATSSFYAKGDTVTPTKIGVFFFTIFIPIKFFCYYKFGIAGLAIVISSYFIANLLTQLFFLRKHLR